MAQQLVSHSYCHGSAEVPLQFWRCFDRLGHWADLTPDRDMVVFRQPNAPRQAISFGEFHRVSDGVAGHVIGAHPTLRTGSSVLVLGPNCLDYCIVTAALYKAGLVTVKLHPQEQASLQSWCRRSDVKAVFFEDDGVFRTGAEWLCDLVPIRVNFQALIEAGRQLANGDRSELQDLLKQRQSQFSADSDFCMYPTSGTTGKPKLVVHSHFAMVNSVRFRAMGALLASQDVFFSDRATAHVVGEFGLQMAMLDGTTLVITPTNIFACDRTAKNANWLLGILEEERVTSGDFFGYLIHDILHRAGRAPPACLRSALIAGSMTTSQQMEKAMAVLPGISNYYGTTETCMISAVCPPWGPTDDRRARRDTVGLPAMHMEVVITAPGSRLADPLAVGDQGEIWVRGFSVMRRYHDDPEKTREVVNEAGWYQTGDLGCMDCCGRITVTGRIKDLIIRATVNIIPSCIEEVLLANPEVHAAVVLGLPDERLGEEVAACVVLRRGRPERGQPELLAARDLSRWCRARGLAETRDGLSSAPRYWAFLGDLPTSGIGKVVRSVMRDHVTNGGGFIDGLAFLSE